MEIEGFIARKYLEWSLNNLPEARSSWAVSKTFFSSTEPGSRVARTRNPEIDSDPTEFILPPASRIHLEYCEYYDVNIFRVAAE